MPVRTCVCVLLPNLVHDCKLCKSYVHGAEGLPEEAVRRLAPGPLLQLRSAMRTLVEAWLEGMAQVSEALARTMVAAAMSAPAAGTSSFLAAGIGGGMRLANSGAAATGVPRAGHSQPLRVLWLRALRLYYQLHQQVQEWGSAHHMPWLGPSWRRTFHAAMTALSLISPLSSLGHSQRLGGSVGAVTALARGMRGAAREGGNAGSGGSNPSRVSLQQEKAEVEKLLASAGQLAAANVPRATVRQAASAAYGAQEAKKGVFASGKSGVAQRTSASVTAAVTTATAKCHGLAQGQGLVQSAGSTAAAPRTLLAYYAQAQAVMGRMHISDAIDACAGHENADAVRLAAGNKMLADLCHVQLLDLLNAFSSTAPVLPVIATTEQDSSHTGQVPVGDGSLAGATGASACGAGPHSAPACASLVFRHHAADQQALVDVLPPERLMRLAINPVTLALLAARLEQAPVPPAQGAQSAAAGHTGQAAAPSHQQPEAGAPAVAGAVAAVAGRGPTPGQPTRITPTQRSSRPQQDGDAAGAPCAPSPIPPPLRAAIQYGFTLFMHQMHGRMAVSHYMSHAALFPPSRLARRQADAAVAAADSMLAACVESSAAAGQRTSASQAPGDAAGGPVALPATHLLHSQMLTLVISELPVTSLLISLTSPTMLRRLMQHACSSGGLLRALAESKAAAASAPAAAAVAAVGLRSRPSQGAAGGLGSGKSQGSSSTEEEAPNPVTTIVDTLCEVLARQAAPSTAPQLKQEMAGAAHGSTPKPQRALVREPGVLACAVWPLLANDASDRSATTMLSPLRDIFQVVQVGMLLIQRTANQAATTPHLYPGAASMRDLCVAHAQALGLSGTLHTLLQQLQVLAHSEWFDHAEPLSRASTLARALSKTFASTRSRCSSDSMTRPFFSCAPASACPFVSPELTDDAEGHDSLLEAYLKGVPEGEPGGTSSRRGSSTHDVRELLAAASPAGYVIGRVNAQQQQQKCEQRSSCSGVTPTELDGGPVFVERRSAQARPRPDTAPDSLQLPEEVEQNRPSGRGNRRVHPLPIAVPDTAPDKAPESPDTSLYTSAGQQEQTLEDPPKLPQPPKSPVRMLSRLAHAGSGVVGWYLASAPSDPASSTEAERANPVPPSHVYSQLAGPLYLGIPGWRAPGPGSTVRAPEWVAGERKAVQKGVLPVPHGLGSGPCPCSGLVTSVPLSGAQLRVMEGLHLHQLHLRAMLGLSSDLLAQEVRVVGRRLMGLPCEGSAGTTSKWLGSSSRHKGGTHDAGWPPRSHPMQPSKGMVDTVDQLLRPMLKALLPLLPGSQAYLASLVVTCIMVLYSEKVGGSPAAQGAVAAAGGAAAAHLAAQVALDCDLLREELGRHGQAVRSLEGAGGVARGEGGGIGGGAGAWGVVGPALGALVRQVQGLESGWAARLGA